MNFLDLIFPNDIYCIACGRPLPAGAEASLCESCSLELNWVSGRLCKKCGKPLAKNNQNNLCYDCMLDEHCFNKGYSCVLYNERAANIIRDMKYRDRPYYYEAIAKMMAYRINAASDDDTGELPHWDAVVPVPMFREKKEKRGFNQAELIARELAKILNIRFYANAIEKKRDTGIMSSLSLGDRKQNLSGVFNVNPAVAKELVFKDILLVDDVYTTGSTADACAKVLMDAGGNTIDLITFAIGADAGQKSAQDVVSDAELFYNSADNQQIGC